MTTTTTRMVTTAHTTTTMTWNTMRRHLFGLLRPVVVIGVVIVVIIISSIAISTRTITTVIPITVRVSPTSTTTTTFTTTSTTSVTVDAFLLSIWSGDSGSRRFRSKVITDQSFKSSSSSSSHSRGNGRILLTVVTTKQQRFVRWGTAKHIHSVPTNDDFNTIAVHAIKNDTPTTNTSSKNGTMVPVAVSSSSSSSVLTRPQRKALERMKKNEKKKPIMQLLPLSLPLLSPPLFVSTTTSNTTTTTTTTTLRTSASHRENPPVVVDGEENDDDTDHDHNNDSHPQQQQVLHLQRVLRQIQVTQNRYQLRQLILSSSSGSDSDSSGINMILNHDQLDDVIPPRHILTRMIVAAIHCSDYQLIQHLLLPQWNNMNSSNNNGRMMNTQQPQSSPVEVVHSNRNHRYQDAVMMIRSFLFVTNHNNDNNDHYSRSNIDYDNNNNNNNNGTDESNKSMASKRDNTVNSNERRAQTMQYSITAVWNIIDTELSLPNTNGGTDDETVGGDGFADEGGVFLLYYRSKALILISTWYFIQNEPLLAIQTCQLLEQAGNQLVSSTMAMTNTTTLRVPQRDKNDRPQHAFPKQQQQQLSWIRLFQEASYCQSRIRQNNCTSAIQSATALRQTPVSAVSELPSNVVYAVLSARSSFPKQYNDYDNNSNDRIYELISNALVRRVVFVTGAVSMAGCPRNDDDTAEVCFIGRSNVGKSSLINMIFNRKALAYTSKRPGKTQQFNFFTVNDIPDKEKEIKYGDDIAGRTGKTKDTDSFYIVDLPGFGYAKVPEAQKQKWMQFMYEYLTTRTNLRIIFHLIDSRHGPMNDDRIIMQQMSTTLQRRSSDNLRYVIVLTKADKNVKGNSSGKSSHENNNKKQQRSSMNNINNSGGKVSKTIQIAVEKAMEECRINRNRTPIVLSSAETKLGRDEIWKYLQIATQKNERK